MHNWMDCTFSIASDTNLEVTESPAGDFELAFTKPMPNGGTAGLSVIFERETAERIHAELGAILSDAPAEAAP